MFLKTSAKYISYIALSVTLAACGTSTTVDDTLPNTDGTTVVQKEKNTKVQKMLSSLPSQTETLDMLSAAGAKYNSKNLNPIENVSKYSSVKARALNLGVYGIDLGVTSLFDQSQESIVYLRCTNKLATGLGISGSFGDDMTSRIDANSGNKDSMLAIVSQSFRNADNYLQENGQPGVSTLMVAGGWIEGLYISTQIAKTTKNEVIINRIGQEKSNLDVLISLLESYKAENQGTDDIIASLKELKKIFDGIAVATPETAVKVTTEQFKQISEKSTDLRTKIIQ